MLVQQLRQADAGCKHTDLPAVRSQHTSSLAGTVQHTAELKYEDTINIYASEQIKVCNQHAEQALQKAPKTGFPKPTTVVLCRIF